MSTSREPDYWNEPTYWNDHHLLPQAEEFEQRFIDAGLDPDDYTVTIYKFQHEALHPEWNRDWREFFEDHPHPTPSDILQQMDQMREFYGLADHDVHTHQDPAWYDPFDGSRDADTFGSQPHQEAYLNNPEPPEAHTHYPEPQGYHQDVYEDHLYQDYSHYPTYYPE